MYVTLRSFRGSRSATFCRHPARVCRVRVGDHVHRRRTSVPYGRVTAGAPVTRRPPRTVHARSGVGSSRAPCARAAPTRDATAIFHIRFRTILKIEYVARVFTFTRSLIDSDCVLLRNTRWGTAIAIG